MGKHSRCPSATSFIYMEARKPVCAGGEEPVTLALIGCGAVSECLYAPAISGLARDGLVVVTQLIDPLPTRTKLLARHFPEARQSATIQAFADRPAQLAIVASPQRFHAEQSVALLEMGAHVLCEKPMASTADEARQMVEVADKHRRLLAIGLFRRLFPSSRFVQELIQSGALGRPISVDWIEGNVFGWPAASASFFDTASSPGGVFADIGAHVLDLLLWWFGDVETFHYSDDAMGGLEANCLLRMKFANGVHGSVRLSRDTDLRNQTTVRFENGWVRFAGASANDVTLGFRGCDIVGKAALDQAETPADQERDAYKQAFMGQLLNVCRAAQGNVELVVSGREALKGVEFIEQCYQRRRLMAMPWLTADEVEAGHRLASVPDGELQYQDRG